MSEELLMTWSSIERTNQEHDGNLLNFLEVCRKNNLTLNLDKIQFRLAKVSFFGHTWSDKGLSADPKKIKAVRKNGTSTGCRNHEKFPCRLTNYPNQFNPCLAELSGPLRETCRIENGIQVKQSLWGCISVLQRGNFQKYHTSILQS